MDAARNREEESMEEDFELQQIAASSVLAEVDGCDDGRLLSFCWGNGCELFCCDVDRFIAGGVVQWQAGEKFEIGSSGQQQSNEPGRNEEMFDTESRSSCIRWCVVYVSSVCDGCYQQFRAQLMII